MPVRPLLHFWRQHEGLQPRELNGAANLLSSYVVAYSVLQQSARRFSTSEYTAELPERAATPEMKFQGTD